MFDENGAGSLRAIVRAPGDKKLCLEGAFEGRTEGVFLEFCRRNEGPKKRVAVVCRLAEQVPDEFPSQFLSQSDSELI